MGKTAPKRLIRKLDIELFMSRIEPYSDPKVNLEQYSVTESVAATILYLAGYIHDDIIGRKVLDLGCGTGRLALGAAFLGAEMVVGVDIDKSAIITASANSEKAGLKTKVHLVVEDVNAISGIYDTVLQNPPFGVQKRSADRKFLAKAIEVGTSVYSLHNHPFFDKQLIKQLKAAGEHCIQIPPSPFLTRFIEDKGGRVEAVYALLMTIPRMFDFHTKAKHDFVVDLYLIRRKN